MFYINKRWLGGALTNFKTIKKNIQKLKDLENMKADGRLEQLSKKEALEIFALTKSASSANRGIPLFFSASCDR